MPHLWPPPAPPPRPPPTHPLFRDRTAHRAGHPSTPEACYRSSPCLRPTGSGEDADAPTPGHGATVSHMGDHRTSGGSGRPACFHRWLEKAPQHPPVIANVPGHSHTSCARSVNPDPCAIVTRSVPYTGDNCVSHLGSVILVFICDRHAATEDGLAGKTGHPSLRGRRASRRASPRTGPETVHDGTNERLIVKSA